jgi:hypothetical protein
VTTAAAILHLGLGFKPTFAEAAMVVSLYTVAAHRPRRQAVAAALAFAAAMVGYGLIAQARYPSSFQDSLQAWVLTFIQFAAAFFLGDAQQRRLGYMAKLEALNASWPRSRSCARAGRWPPSGAGSPVSCTTSSPTR